MGERYHLLHFRFFRYDRSMADGDDGTKLAARRVAVAERIVAEQKALIDRLKAARQDTAGAERLLHSYETFQHARMKMVPLWLRRAAETR